MDLKSKNAPITNSNESALQQDCNQNNTPRCPKTSNVNESRALSALVRAQGRGVSMTIALNLNNGYSKYAAKQIVASFSRLNRQRRTYRPLIGGFFTSAPCLSAPLWTGCGGEGLRPADFLCHQPANPATCLSASFSSERQVIPDIGGHNMASTSISARPEQQTQSPNTFHLAARAARKAARQWFAGIPTQSLAVWRDTCRAAHCNGLPNSDSRSAAFDDAFAREIGNLIIAGGRSHV